MQFWESSEWELANPFVHRPWLEAFKDYPFWGYRAKVRRHLVKTMKRRLRGEESFTVVYDRDWVCSEMPIGGLAIRDEVCRMIMFEFGWPNSLYLPADPLELLFWLRVEDLEWVSLWNGIEKRYGIDIGDREAWEGKKLVDLCRHVANLMLPGNDNLEWK